MDETQALIKHTAFWINPTHTKIMELININKLNNELLYTLIIQMYLLSICIYDLLCSTFR